jgi:hypothetical protein
MKHLPEIIPAVLILTAFIIYSIYVFIQQVKSERRKEKIIYIKDAMNKAKTQDQIIDNWNEIMDLKSRGNCKEVQKLIDLHIEKFRS